MRIENVNVDKSCVRMRIKNVTVDRSFIIMRIENETVDNLYVTMVRHERYRTISKYIKNRW